MNEMYAYHLNVTLAAHELCVTQGAVSRMLQALEAELGTALFLRMGRTLALTPAGAAYHPPIQEALDRIAAATGSVRHMDAGWLSISVQDPAGEGVAAGRGTVDEV